MNASQTVNSCVNSDSIAAVVLAGGYSRRMGRDKALLLWDSEPMLQRVYGVARSIASRVVVVSGWNDRYSNLTLPECEFLEDRQSGAGPLVALEQALEHFNGADVTKPTTEWVLLLACDLPCLDREHLRQLCDRAARSDAETQAIVPCSERGWEPLCALYRHSIQTSLQAFTVAGGRSFQRWFEQLDREPAMLEPIDVDRDDRLWLHNCNTPADLAASQT